MRSGHVMGCHRECCEQAGKVGDHQLLGFKEIQLELDAGTYEFIIHCDTSENESNVA